jgi:large subunit ribosomal protein L29
MKAENLRELTEAELDVQLRETESQLWKLRFQAATGQTEGARKLRELRKDLARIRTILREKELEKEYAG